MITPLTWHFGTRYGGRRSETGAAVVAGTASYRAVFGRSADEAGCRTGRRERQ